MTKPNILILGYARHGKDEVAAMLKRWYGLDFKSSSLFAIENGVFEKLKSQVKATTPQELYETRGEYRELLYHAIRDYNSPDKATLTKGILSVANVYVGMRDMEEFEASRYYFDLIVWIDSTERVGSVETGSMDIPMSVADIVIQNNGSLEDLKQKVTKLFNVIFTCRENKDIENHDRT